MKLLSAAARLFSLVFAVSGTFGCVSSGEIKPFTPQSLVAEKTEGENRLWHAARKFDVQLKRSGQIYSDVRLQAYVQGIMDKLYPEYVGILNVQLLKAPVLNAFALPDGHIYVNLGLLAAMENEAQLATVLAHEGVHFINKHGALQRENMHAASGFAIAVSLLGIPLVGDLIAISSMMGFSQEHEWESDSDGFVRLKMAGYDVREAPKTFSHLLRESKANKVEEPFFFSTHPQLEERIKSFEKLIEESDSLSEGRLGIEAYQENVGAVRRKVLVSKIEHGRYDAVIAVLSDENLRTIYSEDADFLLGEAYRLRNAEGDLDLARNAYQLAIDVSMLPEAYRGLARIEMAKGRDKSAIQYFQKYLELKPDATDKAYVKQYLDQLNSEDSES